MQAEKMLKQRHAAEQREWRLMMLMKKRCRIVFTSHGGQCIADVWRDPDDYPQLKRTSLD